MRRFAVMAAVAAMFVGGSDVSAFAGTYPVYGAAGLVQWSETYQDQPGDCGTSYYWLDIITAVRTEGRQWEGEVRQTPFYGGTPAWIPCGATDPSIYPGVWVTGSFSNPVTGAVAKASGTCGGRYGAAGLSLFCDLRFDGAPTTLNISALSGQIIASCASAGYGSGCNYTAPGAAVRAEQS